MTPTTLETPDALDEELDSQGDGEAGSESANGSAGDSTDGSADGSGLPPMLLVDTIEIKFRKGSKSSATIRVFEDAGASAFYCRVHYEYPEDRVGNANSEVCASKPEAVIAALDLLAVQFHGHAKAMEDLGKFRTKFEARCESEREVEQMAAALGGDESGDTRTNEPFLDENSEADQAARDAVEAENEPKTEQASPEAHFETRLRAAADNLVARVLATMKAESSHKFCKAQEKLAKETLQELTDRGVEHYPLFDGEHGSNGIATDVSPDAATAHAQASNAPLPADQSWRTVPTSELCIGPPLIGKLAEAGIETIGQLEDKRGEGSMPGAGLRSIKGIGQAKADKIEEAILAWLSTNRDAQVLAEAAGGAVSPVEAASNPAAAAETAPATTDEEEII